jgi:hypothetical protein
VAQRVVGDGHVHYSFETRPGAARRGHARTPGNRDSSTLPSARCAVRPPVEPRIMGRVRAGRAVRVPARHHMVTPAIVGGSMREQSATHTVADQREVLPHRSREPPSRLAYLRFSSPSNPRSCAARRQ